jgi:hypothetical protein
MTKKAARRGRVLGVTDLFDCIELCMDATNGE